MIDRFMEAVSRLEGLSLLDQHRIARTAKLLRRRIEAGEEPSEAEWKELFPHDEVRAHARTELGDPADCLNYDFEATWVGANARASKELDGVIEEAAKAS